MLGSCVRCALAAFVASVVASGAAQAVQFTPTATARAHTLGNPPGIEYNSGGLGVGGQLAYDAGTQTLTLGGAVDVINFYDPANGACPTDSLGSTCSFNTNPDLALAMDAKLAAVTVQPLGGGFYNIIADFQSTPNSLPDVVWTDPTDSTQVLRGNWVAGTYDDGFGPTATSGLTAFVLYDSNTGTATLKLADTRGFLAADPSTLYASLFANGDGNYFALDIGSIDQFSDGAGGGLDAIVAAALQNGSFPSFTAEINGQLYRVATGSFEVPEPGTAPLLALGLGVLAARRRRS